MASVNISFKISSDVMCIILLLLRLTRRQYIDTNEQKLLLKLRVYSLTLNSS